MNRALTYLWFSLLKRKAARSIWNLRRPTALIGFASILFFLGVLFHYRHEKFFAEFVRPASLIGGALIMLGGSLFKGFLQRGLLFEPPDVEFLFTSPFTQRQIVLYHLLPGYLYALVQGAIFAALFQPHLKHPFLTFGCLTLFQIACFHISTGAAIYGGSISEEAHHRVRWMILGVYLFITVFYLKSAWDLRLVPSLLSSPLFQPLFYPGISVTDLASAAPIKYWTTALARGNLASTYNLCQPLVYLCVFAVGAGGSLWLLLQYKADIFESSLATTARATETRLRLQEGRSVATPIEVNLRSARMPTLPFCRGAGALIWKNLVVASRSKRELTLAAAYTLIYTGFLLALMLVMRRFMAEGGGLPVSDRADFDKGIVGMVACLAFFLQRSFPFDFRRDGQHLVNFRTLPISPFALALAEIAVPAACCLLFQAIGIAILIVFARFDWLMMLLILAAFPAIALALNGVWNLYYLLAASRRAGGKAESASAVGLVTVVTLSFLIFYPAGWAALKVGRHAFGRFSEVCGIGTWLVIQYSIDLLLIWLLATLFHRFEVSRDA